MSPFNEEGHIRQQDIRDRNIARQRINESLVKEARRTVVLVDFAIRQVEANLLTLTTIDALWSLLQRDKTMAGIRAVADKNIADYPGFTGWVIGQRFNIENAQKTRLARTLGKRVYQRRFANTVGFRPAYQAA